MTAAGLRAIVWAILRAASSPTSAGDGRMMISMAILAYVLSAGSLCNARIQLGRSVDAVAGEKGQQRPAHEPRRAEGRHVGVAAIIRRPAHVDDQHVGCLSRSRSTAARANAWRWMSRPTTRTASSGLSAGAGRAVVTSNCGWAAKAALVADVDLGPPPQTAPRGRPDGDVRTGLQADDRKASRGPGPPFPGCGLDVEGLDQLDSSRARRVGHPDGSGIAGREVRRSAASACTRSAASRTRSAPRVPSAMASLTACSMSINSSRCCPCPGTAGRSPPPGHGPPHPERRARHWRRPCPAHR